MWGKGSLVGRHNKMAIKDAADWGQDVSRGSRMSGSRSDKKTELSEEIMCRNAA